MRYKLIKLIEYSREPHHLVNRSSYIHLGNYRAEFLFVIILVDSIDDSMDLFNWYMLISAAKLLRTFIRLFDRFAWFGVKNKLSNFPLIRETLKIKYGIE